MAGVVSGNRRKRFPLCCVPAPAVLRLLGCSLAGATAFADLAHADTLTYENARFGTFVTFPAEIFREAMEPPPRGEGMTFLSADGASIAVYAMNNALHATPEAFADQSASGAGIDVEISRRQVGDDWVVLSGWNDGEIFHKRFVFGDDNIIHGLTIKYIFSQRDNYDGLVEEIAASFGGP